jgi:twinkle protein
MANVIPDDIDFSEYLRETSVRVKVRKASIYKTSLLDYFFPPIDAEKPNGMLSNKLSGLIHFRRGEVTVWSGYNGHRKSMFVGQMVLDLCVQNQQTLLASFEMLPTHTLARMTRQCFAIAAPSEWAIHTFARWTDDKLWLFDHLGRINPQQVIAVMRYFASELGGKHVVIDSMMMVCASEESLDEQKQFMTDLVRTAQETGLHIHLVAHCRKPLDESKPPTKYDLRGSAALSDQAHNVVTVWANKAKVAKLEIDPGDSTALAMPDALVAVEKQRNGVFEGRIKLWFDDASLRFVNNRTAAVEPYVLSEC